MNRTVTLTKKQWEAVIQMVGEGIVSKRRTEREQVVPDLAHSAVVSIHFQIEDQE